jgi:hypothetical protein
MVVSTAMSPSASGGRNELCTGWTGGFGSVPRLNGAVTAQRAIPANPPSYFDCESAALRCSSWPLRY